jgi:hypothetical protein
MKNLIVLIALLIVASLTLNSQVTCPSGFTSQGTSEISMGSGDCTLEFDYCTKPTGSTSGDDLCDIYIGEVRFVGSQFCLDNQTRDINGNLAIPWERIVKRIIANLGSSCFPDIPFEPNSYTIERIFHGGCYSTLTVFDEDNFQWIEYYLPCDNQLRQCYQWFNIAMVYDEELEDFVVDIIDSGPVAQFTCPTGCYPVCGD